MKKKMKILVTGGTGFVGNYLVKRIEKKYDVKIFSKDRGDFVGDLKNYGDVEKAIEGRDIIIHLAYSKNYSENIIMTENIIRACKKNKIKKIILLSSMSAKRNHPDAYGKNKLHIENMIENSKLNYTILRPSIIYGKESKSFDFIVSYLKKLPFVPIIGTGKYKISPVYVEDVVKAIEKCIKNKKTDKKEYDLPGGSSIYFVDLINVLKKELNIRKRNIHIPIFFCNLVALIFPKSISKENIKNLTEDTKAEIKKAEKDFDYKPIKFSERKNGLI